MIEDTAAAVETLRAVLAWLDGRDLWQAAIDIDSALEKLTSPERKGLTPSTECLSDLCH